MTSKKEDETCSRCKKCRRCKHKDDKKKKTIKTPVCAIHAKYKKEMRQRQIQECRDYKTYEKKRREESKRKRQRIIKLKKIILATWPEMSELDIARFLCVLDMVFLDNSLRVHVEYMYDHSDFGILYDLKNIPSKSGLSNWVHQFANMSDWVRELLTKQAEDDAYGTLLGDSSGFSIMKYEDWEDAKRGIISRREFDKLHILLAPHGMIAACQVTKGRRHDSPVFREMYKLYIPKGKGHVILDAAYPAKKNCELIKDSGRIPVICFKKNMKPKGFNALAEMFRWYQEDREGYDKIYHQRSLVETAFSVIKARFGATARGKLESVRSLLLTLKCICYNLVS